MTEENIELLDAREFKRKLIALTKDSNDEEGQRIGEYLKNVVPDWVDMRATRLYKHIQGMLKNVEENKRFEIELVWKRGIYIISLMAILSTGFGYLFINIYVIDIVGKNYSNIYVTNMFDNFSNIEEKKNFLSRTLVLIALANAFLSIYLAIINKESLLWQRNWEHHVDYLQTTLGFNLMRVTIRPKRKLLAVAKINNYVSLFMALAWSLVAIAISLSGAKLFYSLSDLPSVSTANLNSPIEQKIWSIFESISVFDFFIIVFIFYLAYLFLISLIGRGILKHFKSTHKFMYTRNLEKFRLYEEQPETNNHSKLLHSVITRFLNKLP